MIANDRSGDSREARFWAVDLHVHTPASRDVSARQYGSASPQDIVNSALSAGLAAIAVTDHNTAAWCDEVAAAAAETNLVVLPGVEISTGEGHLLAIFEEGTPSADIDELLVAAGLPSAKRGDLNSISTSNMVETAERVADAGGLSIPAHIDREKGLLKNHVPVKVKNLLLTRVFAAFEIVDLDTCHAQQRRVATSRQLTFVRGSDSSVAGEPGHRLEGIGRRRTWVKAARPDVRGLRHAFSDPRLRVRCTEPLAAAQPYIRSVSVAGGFLDKVSVTLSADLTALVGGTGVGKSLILELIRFALDQQTDASEFPAIRSDVESRLQDALGDGSSVELTIVSEGLEFRVRRPYHSTGSPAPEVLGSSSHTTVTNLLPIRAFSQGEVIEYARAPVSRMSLIDGQLDLSQEDERESAAITQLEANGHELAQVLRAIDEAQEELDELPAVASRIDELSSLFDAEVVKTQALWRTEKVQIDDLESLMPDQTDLSLPVALRTIGDASNPSNQELFERARAAIEEMRSSIDAANAQVADAWQRARSTLESIKKEWEARHAEFVQELNAAIEAFDSNGKGLAALRSMLGDLQGRKASLDATHRTLHSEVLPRRISLLTDRRAIVDQLCVARQRRRAKRQARVAQLNSLMSGDVRIKIHKEMDDKPFRSELTAIARGSHLRAETLDALGSEASPTKLVWSFLESDAEGVSDATGIDHLRVERLFEHVSTRGLVEDFLALQTVELRDGLAVEFRKEREGAYTPIERLAHGQKCTAILIVALADGTWPLVIDQPEDALHAPWIEEQLVERLRELRGSRQFIFATRSPGLVISADAEMIVTLTSSSDRASVEASGSLERHDLNRLALYHLEGGAEALRRRSEKLAPSIRPQQPQL